MKRHDQRLGSGSWPRRWMAAALMLATAAACESVDDRASPGDLAGRSVVWPEPGSVEAWQYLGAPGRIIRTPHYDLHTTVRHPMLLDRLPPFLEAAYAHYQCALIPLNEPPEPMRTYVFDRREEWDAFTKATMGDRAGPYLRIQRGGYSVDGESVLYDIGLGNTLTIAAHEGWHQYTQNAFEGRLPIWLEEGIATWMEGHRVRGDEVEFRPWLNPERFGQLVRARWRQRLLSLPELLEAHPERLLTRSQDGTLDYYAQVWALVHFLNEGAGGKYRDGLIRLVRDAQSGAVPGGRSGPELFEGYFGGDLAAVTREYDAFVQSLAIRGHWSRIVRGQSPLIEP